MDDPVFDRDKVRDKDDACRVSIDAEIERIWPRVQWQDETVVVAVSGGPDSVVLLHALRRLASRPSNLIVAHWDHALRGRESDEDREFVRGMAASLGCPVRIERADSVSSLARAPSEDVLRRQRHGFLRRVAEESGAAWIATGHHADDCVETFVHRLLRGSGPSGLAAMAPTRSLSPRLTLVRPLLAVPRAEIEAYLVAKGLECRRDASNASPQYTRNRIRHQLLPAMRAILGTPHLDRRLWTAAQLVREEHDVIIKLADAWLARTTGACDSDFVEFPLEACWEVEWPILREAWTQVWHRMDWPLRGMSAAHWNRIRVGLEASRSSPHPRRLQLPHQILVTIRRGRVRLERGVP